MGDEIGVDCGGGVGSKGTQGTREISLRKAIKLKCSMCTSVRVLYNFMKHFSIWGAEYSKHIHISPVQIAPPSPPPPCTLARLTLYGPA